MRSVVSRLLAATFALAGAASSAHAALCVADNVPAATLLVPYFEAGSAFTSPDTRVNVANHGEAPVVAQVTLWTDGGQPVFTFPIHLAGHARHEFSLRTLVFSGQINASSPASNATFSTTLNALTGCTSAILQNRFLPAADALRLRQALQGVANDQGMCGFPYGDALARGYVTIDARNNCTALLPNDPNYYATIGHANVLTGSYDIVSNPTSSSFNASGGNAVAIESDATGTVVAPGDRSFYGQFTGTPAADRREPLPTRWQVDRAPSASTQPPLSDVLIAWRQGPARANLCSAGAPLGHSVAEPVRFFDATGASTTWLAPVSPTLASPFALAARAIPVQTAFAQAGAFVRADVRLLDDPTNSGQSYVALRTQYAEMDTFQPGRARDGSCRAQTISQSIGPADTGPIPRRGAIEFVDSFESIDVRE